jgi:all-trans-retinol dehydrogenase (NAD+)
MRLTAFSNKLPQALNEETAKNIVSLGGKAFSVICDVTDPKAVRSAASLTRGQLGEVDILVNNAGVMPCRRLLDLSEDEIQRTMDINCTSHFWVSFVV